MNTEPSLAISQDAVPNTSVAAAPSEPGSAPSGSSKKHKKHKEKTGDISKHSRERHCASILRHL